MFGLQPSHMSRDTRQFPQRDFKTPKDFARSETAQHLDVLFRDTAEAEPLGDAVHVAQEPRQAVGERAVEVENNKRVGHYPKRTRGVLWRNALRLMSRNTLRYSALRALGL